MQILLAPSKTMTVDFALPSGVTPTQPYFMEEAHRIVNAVKRSEDIASLMHISDALTSSVRALYAGWNEIQAPALYAYRGDVYRWFFVEALSGEDIRWAQERLLILSGVYGALRPLDLISPYRLEMKTKLSVDGSDDLYTFWGDRIARYADNGRSDPICNLSSDEYAKVVTKWTHRRVVTPIFLDNKNNGTVGTVPIYSKMMRGVMARWIIDNKVDSPEEISAFRSQGYAYDVKRSTADTPAFYRTHPKPIRF